MTLRHDMNRKTAEATEKASSVVAKLARGVVVDGGSAAAGRDCAWAKEEGQTRRTIGRHHKETFGSRSSDKCLDCRSRGRDMARRKTRRASTSVSSSNTCDIN